MGKIKVILASIICIIGFNSLQAQDLNCTVTLRFDQLTTSQGADAQLMNQLKDYISNFMNNTKFASERIKQEERIKCNLNINLLKSNSQGAYEGTAQLSVIRPVFNSAYESVTLSYVDRSFNFTFQASTPLFFNENSYTEELPFTLAYYANIILALDYDSFSKLGGTPYVQKAFNLANLARNSSSNQKSWSGGTDIRTRYWLVENLMNQQLNPVREALYNYHRLGLDKMTASPVEARATIIQCLNTIKQVAQLRPSTLLVNSFFDAKAEELYNVLREASPEERQQCFTILSSLDPAKTESYRRLVSGQ